MRKTVLVLDDEPHMIHLLRLNLEPEGYRVVEARDGEEAYQSALSLKPDVLLMDVVVPKRSGIDVCKALKANPETYHIPVILISGRGEGMRKSSLEAGADLFLMKPFSSLKLLSEIRRMARMEEGLAP